MATVTDALQHLFDQAINRAEDQLLRTPFDPEWRSAAEFRQEGDETLWRPVRQSPPVDFSGLANAIDGPVHPDISNYYASFWAGTLEATSAEGHVSLIQLWNEDDFERLIGNLIGHYMAKKRQRNPFTVFFANTEPDSELFLSINNDDGAVLLEEPGTVLKQVDSDIASFLKRLTPSDALPSIY